jgi:hypothetical protein
VEVTIADSVKFWIGKMAVDVVIFFAMLLVALLLLWVLTPSKPK